MTIIIRGRFMVIEPNQAGIYYLEWPKEILLKNRNINHHLIFLIAMKSADYTRKRAIQKQKS